MPPLVIFSRAVAMPLVAEVVDVVTLFPWFSKSAAAGSEKSETS
jgi:hypothetical protein